MTKEEALEQMLALVAHARSMEKDHILADDILCALLRSLGCGDVVDAYDKLSKWYA